MRRVLAVLLLAPLALAQESEPTGGPRSRLARSSTPRRPRRCYEVADLYQHEDLGPLLRGGEYEALRRKYPPTR
ncbi:MAG: hypothetical protein ACYTEZ_05690 [Planctomycetota bacterium]